MLHCYNFLDSDERIRALCLFEGLYKSQQTSYPWPRIHLFSYQVSCLWLSILMDLRDPQPLCFPTWWLDMMLGAFGHCSQAPCHCVAPFNILEHFYQYLIWSKTLHCFHILKTWLISEIQLLKTDNWTSRLFGTLLLLPAFQRQELHGFFISFPLPVIRG